MDDLNRVRQWTEALIFFLRRRPWFARYGLRSGRWGLGMLCGLLLATCGLLWQQGAVAAEQRCITVFYPEVREPYRTVLEEIMTGIEEGTAWKVQRRPVADDAPANASAVGTSCTAAIGLGRTGLNVVAALSGRVPVVAGAVLNQPGASTDFPVVSLVADPGALILRLKHFLPKVKKVAVVYNPDTHGRFIAMAEGSARSMGIVLETHPATDLRNAVPRFKAILDSTTGESTALWLLRDPATVDNRVVLPMVLEESWKRRIVVFSSQPAHVKNGVLFSVYPDNHGLGRRLAALAERCGAGECSSTQVMALEDVRTAVNLRTAARLGIEVDPRRDSYVDLVFPAR